MRAKRIKSTTVAVINHEKRKEQLFRVKERLDENLEDIWWDEYREKVGLLTPEEEVQLDNLAIKMRRDRALKLNKRDRETKKIPLKEKPNRWRAFCNRFIKRRKDGSHISN